MLEIKSGITVINLERTTEIINERTKVINNQVNVRLLDSSVF